MKKMEKVLSEMRDERAFNENLLDRNHTEINKKIEMLITQVNHIERKDEVNHSHEGEPDEPQEGHCTRNHEGCDDL